MTSQIVFFMYGRLWYCNGIVFKEGGVVMTLWRRILWSDALNDVTNCIVFLLQRFQWRHMYCYSQEKGFDDVTIGVVNEQKVWTMSRMFMWERFQWRHMYFLWAKGFDDVTNGVSTHGTESSTRTFPLLDAALVAGAHVTAGVQDAVDIWRKKIIKNLRLCLKRFHNMYEMNFLTGMVVVSFNWRFSQPFWGYSKTMPGLY